MTPDPIGTSVARVDGVSKVTGRAKYTADLSVHGMCHASVLRSPVPHARIKAIDTRRAEATTGVVAVLTAADLHGVNPYFGSLIKDRPLIAIERVRHVGEPVVAVAARTPEIADAAIGLVDVEYEELPAVLSIEAAIAPDAPRLHSGPKSLGVMFHSEALQQAPDDDVPNVCHKKLVAFGDPERGLAEADAVFEDTYTFPAVYHYAMEPYACVADVTADGISVWCSAQHPFVVRTDLSEMFGVPLNRVRVVVPYVGGGFGSKSYTKIEPLVVALARKAGRPVRLVCSVEEAMYTNRRHGATVTMRTGVKRDGTLTARLCAIHLDTGAYADNGPQVTNKAANRVLGPYYCGNVRVECRAIYTNTSPAGSFRAIGGPQTIWALESQMDRIADALRIDPVALRTKNLLRRGATWIPGTKPFDADLEPTLRTLAATIGEAAAPAASADAARGTGIACGMQDSTASPVATSIVRLHVDGTATVCVGTTELGQGSRTVFSQMAAHELTLPIDRILVVSSDSDVVPFDRSTGASRSTTITGTAVQEALRDLAAQLRVAAGAMFGVAADDVTLADGELRGGGKAAPIDQVIRHYFGLRGGELIGRGYVRKAWGDQRFAANPAFFENGMTGVVVRVDPETGRLAIERLVTVADVGKALNPRLAEGQDEGAAMMGIGHTCFEEMRWEGGQLLNANLVDYRVPTFEELPQCFETIMVENGDGPGPYGAKGLGEGGVLAVAPAVGNAVARALGVRIHDLPLTPERVWQALRARRAAEA